MPESFRGQFLIASQALRDSNFYQAVILLLEHGPGGALGLVVNRPTSVKVTKALGGQIELPDRSDRLFVGGPVQSTALFIMHNGAKPDDASHEVIPNLFVGASAESLHEVIRAAGEEKSVENPVVESIADPAANPVVKFRIFSGCSGWGPGQLEYELDRADWQLQPAEAEFVLDHDPHEIWSTLRQRFSILPNLRGDPKLN